MKYSFSDQLDIYAGEGGWYFVRLPREMWDEIRALAAPLKRGFGSFKVSAKIGNTSWQTSIFPDTKSKRYILFIKKSVRHAEHIEINDTVDASVEILNT